MRKVELKMNEQRKYDLIKKLIETNGNKRRTAKKLDISIRQVNRLIRKYIDDGKKGFVHGNRGKQPVTTKNKELREEIVELYTSKYFDCNFRHFQKLLYLNEAIQISETALRDILFDEYIISPKAHKKTKRKITKLLNKKKKEVKSKKEQSIIQSKIVDINDAHPSQPRTEYFGEELQMDASEHLWFGNTKTFLHAVIDDSSGEMVGMYFDTQETLKGYYNITKQFLTNYGIPYMIKTDNRTVFNYNKKDNATDEADTYTQYGYACKQLGIELKSSSIPEFKARIERSFQTLQGRLPAELRLAGITTIKEANKFLKKYIHSFNNEFALCTNNIKSVWDNQVDDSKINLTLAILSERIINKGHSIKYHNKLYKTINSDGLNIYFAKGTKTIIVNTFNNELFATIDDEIYVLEEIPVREEKSPNFNILDEIKPIKRNIPNMNHPWRRKSFKDFVAKQKHRKNDKEDIA